ARRERYDDVHRPRWIGLRPGDARNGRQRGGACGETQKLPSVVRSRRRVHLRVTPGAVGLVIENSPTSSPATPWIVETTAVDTMQCAHGYSGCIGVSPRGSQVACHLCAPPVSGSGSLKEDCMLAGAGIKRILNLGLSS